MTLKCVTATEATDFVLIQVLDYPTIIQWRLAMDHEPWGLSIKRFVLCAGEEENVPKFIAFIRSRRTLQSDCSASTQV